MFIAGAFEAHAMHDADLPALQRFFEANPEYFLAVSGLRPSASEAQEEFDALPPPEMTFDERWLIGYVAPEGGLVAFASILGGFLAPHVWHIGLFIVATQLHGTGVARPLYDALEAWMRSRGAQWIRLGVVEGNARAEAFWYKAGYREVRTREGVTMGIRTNTVRVLAKALGDEGLDRYLKRVRRDNPGYVGL